MRRFYFLMFKLELLIYEAHKIQRANRAWATRQAGIHYLNPPTPLARGIVQVHTNEIPHPTRSALMNC